MMYSFRSQKGLTLIESLVAIFIFSLSLASLMVISSRGIQSVAVASQRATAQFLAQEGIEIVEAIRDDNFLDVNSTSWLENLDVCTTSTGCFISAVEFTEQGNMPLACPSSCPPFTTSQNAAGPEYQYGPGDPTPFVRTIRIEGNNSDEMIPVYSNVRWSRSGVDYDVEVIKYMTNWFQPTLVTP